MKKLAIALVAIPFWLLNPIFTGCATEDKFEFDEADMLDVLDSLNAQTWVTTIDNSNHEIILDLRQATEAQASLTPSAVSLSSAAACSDRAFVASAEACIESSMLYIEGTAMVINLDTEAVLYDSLELSGSMLVVGTALNNADISLNHETGQLRWFSDDGQNLELTDAEW